MTLPHPLYKIEGFQETITLIFRRIRENDLDNDYIHRCTKFVFLFRFIYIGAILRIRNYYAFF